MEIVIRNFQGVEFRTELPIKIIGQALKYEYESKPDVYWVIWEHISNSIFELPNVFTISDPMFIILSNGCEILIEYENVYSILRSIISIERGLKLESLGI